MKKETVLKKLEILLSVYTKESSFDCDGDIMARPLLLSPYDAAAYFLDIEREYAVDLNDVIPCLTVYSLNNIADKIIELCATKSVNELCCT